MAVDRTRAAGLLLLATLAAVATADVPTAGRNGAPAPAPAAYARSARPVGTPAVTLAAGAPLVFGAAPREPEEAAQRLYRPIAEHLGRALGRPVEFQHTGSWGVYRSRVLRGDYDLVFDDPHLNSYRAEHLGHEVLARLPGSTQYAVIARDDLVFRGIQKMHGRTFCTLAPPNLGTLVLLALFDNPLRQPVLLNADDWDTVYEGVVSGRCAAGVLPLAIQQRLDPHGRTRILYFSTELPGQAFSAGPRVNAVERRHIAAALTAPQAAAATAALRAQWRAAGNLVATGNDEYAGLSTYLRDEWGFY
jgi:phosphonate transport system substrate-binding protein